MPIGVLSVMFLFLTSKYRYSEGSTGWIMQRRTRTHARTHETKIGNGLRNRTKRNHTYKTTPTDNNFLSVSIELFNHQRGIIKPYSKPTVE